MNFDINHPRYSMPGFYLSQVFVAVLGLLIPVLLLRYQGVGFLAVVAFFNALQAWFQLIDFGLGSALSRAFAMCNQPIQYSRQELSVRRGERLLLAAGFLLAIFSAWPLVVIYPEWLGDHSDNRFFMGDTLLVMLLALLSRNQLEFYRAILVGCRQLGWLACVVLGMTLLRVALLLLLIYLNRLSLPVFFWCGRGVQSCRSHLVKGANFWIVPAKFAICARCRRYGTLALEIFSVNGSGQSALDCIFSIG